MELTSPVAAASVAPSGATVETAGITVASAARVECAGKYTMINWGLIESGNIVLLDLF